MKVAIFSNLRTGRLNPPSASPPPPEIPLVLIYIRGGNINALKNVIIFILCAPLLNNWNTLVTEVKIGLCGITNNYNLCPVRALKQNSLIVAVIKPN
jgi:hypothetical protein